MNRMMPLRIVLTVLLVTVRGASGYSSGIGVDPACTDMTPQHGTTPQSGPAPYNVTFSPETYAPGQIVKVTLSSTNLPFKGFMIQARNATSCTEALGEFTRVSETSQSCSNKALVHSSGSAKMTLTFNWTSPSTSIGHIVFRATFVQTQSLYWVAVPSGVLRDSSMASTNLAHCNGGTSTQTDSFSTFTKDSQCGKSKGCFSSCDGSSCIFTVSWLTSGTVTNYTLVAAYKGSSSFYMALGLSADNKMGGDSVMGCAYDGTSNFTSFTAENIGKSPGMFTDDSVVLTSKSFSNGVLSCTITRPTTGSGQRYDAGQLWTLLFVVGAASFSNNALIIQNHYRNNFISEKAVTASSYIDIGTSGKDDSLVKAHGCLMVIAWVLFASIGVVVARYYKPVLTGTLLSQKIWFQIHRLSMVLVLIITAIAFIIIFAKEQQWSYVEGEAFYLQGHPIMGVMVMILTILNPVMAMFRPHPGTPKRPIFNWAHSIVGISAHILAVITIFFGIQLQGATTPYYATYIMGAYVAWQLFIKLLLEIITRCNIFNRGRTDTFELNSSNQDTTDKVDTSETQKSGIKKVFVIHCVVIIGLSAAIVAVIGAGYTRDD